MTTNTGHTPTPPPSNLRPPARSIPPVLYPLGFLLLLLAFNFFFTDNFFHITLKDGHLYGSLIDILKNGTPVLLLALGMTLVIATGGIDLSVGAVMAIAGSTAACIIARPDYSPLTALHIPQSLPVVIAVSLFVGLLCGLWNGVLVAFFKLQPIIATLILMVAGRGIGLLITGGQNPSCQNEAFHFLGAGFLFAVPFPFVLAAIIFLVLTLTVRGSALGLLIEATGNNPESARLAGVNATTLKVAVYTLTGFLAAIAGLIDVANIESANANVIGQTLELDAILAAAIGGTVLTGGRFSLLGTLFGALTIQTLTTTILARNIQAETAFILKAPIVLAICLLQSPQFRTLILKPFKRQGAQ